MSPDEMSQQPASIHNFDDYRKRGGGEAPLVRGLAFTDLGNGRRFANQHGDNVRYCEDLGKQKWLVWTPEESENDEQGEVGNAASIGERADMDVHNADSADRIHGGYWKLDRTGKVMRLAKVTCEAIADEDKPADAGMTFIEERGKHYVKTQERKGLMSMLALAQSEPPIPCTPEIFDTDPMLLNCRNGTLDLRDGAPTFRAARREDMITKRVPVNYDPKVAAPAWMQMLRRWMGFLEAKAIKEDNARTAALAACESVIAFLARAVGLSLTGMINDRAVFILYGSGANGKTIFIETIRALFGPDFTSVMPVEALLAGKNAANQIPTDIADLRGKRFAIASETNEADRLSLAKLKRLSGGDMLTGRQLYGQKFDFHPTHHLWLATNHKPNMRNAGKAVFDRIKPVPFKVRIPEKEQMPSEELKAELRAELPGILNWALAGLADWWANGLGAPSEVTEERNKWETEDDLLQHFLDEMTETKEGAREPKGVVYNAWVTYCKERNEFHGSETRFSQWMAEHGVEDARTGRQRFWKNICLVTGSQPRIVEENLQKSREAAEGSDKDLPF